MTTTEIKDKLIHAATRYDRARANRRGYNPYAMAQYFMRIDEVVADIEAGANPREAIEDGFNDRLRDTLLKAIA